MDKKTFITLFTEALQDKDIKNYFISIGDNKYRADDTLNLCSSYLWVDVDTLKDRLIDTVRRKNADYSAGDDAFKNFRYCEQIGVSVEKGILVRICDKIARYDNLSQGKEAQVKDESIADTLLDLCAYIIIYNIYVNEEWKQSSEND